MKYYLYIDESGVLHPNSASDYFVFSGLLVNEDMKEVVSDNYSNALDTLKNNKGLAKNVEMKASKMKDDDKRYLLSNLRKNCNQVFVITNIRRLREETFQTTVNINRYKNYMLTKMVEQVLARGWLESCDYLQLNIDNQNIAYTAMDNLESYLHITFNEDRIRYEDLFDEYDINYIEFSVRYRDSKNFPLIQAADLLANTKYRENELEGAQGYRYLQKDAINLNLPLGRH